MNEKPYKTDGRGSVGILIVISLLWMINYADRSVISITLQSIKQAFDLTDAQAGSLPSMVQLGIALLTLPVSILGDRWLRRKLVMIVALVWSGFTFMTGLATQLWQIRTTFFGIGAGEAGYGPAGQAWLGMSFSKSKRSSIVAIFMACMPIGIALGIFLGGLILNMTGDWRIPFFIFAIPGVILGIIAFFLPDYKVVTTGENALTKKYFQDWITVFKIRSFWLYALATVFMFFNHFAFMAWAPALVMRAYNFSAGTVGSILGPVALVFIFGPLGGMAADRWQRKSVNGRLYYTILFTTLWLVSQIAAMLVIGNAFETWIIFYVLNQVCLGLMIGPMTGLEQDFYPARLRSTSMGLRNIISQLAGAMWGSIVVGAISDSIGGGVHGIQVGLIWSAGIGAVCILFFSLLCAHYPLDSAKVSDEVQAER